MEDESKERRPYEKPVLLVIQLAEEEIMGICKASAVGPGPRTVSCSNCFSSFSGS